VGEKWPGHGKKIELLGQMTLDEMQQLRREKKDPQGAATEYQRQITNGFSQFNDEGNDFCVCRHGSISSVPLIAVSVAVLEKRRSFYFLQDKVAEAWLNCNLIAVDFISQS
jgi:hypothetical protein